MRLSCGTRRFVRAASLVAGVLLAASRSPGDAAPEEPLLRFSTYLGGSGVDSARAAAFGPDGVLWIAANTASADFPGAPRPRASGDVNDVVVIRLDPVTRKVLSTARIGGSRRDEAVALAVDAAGNAYIAGETDSADFPLTAGTSGPSYYGGHPFVARVLPDGSGLAWAFGFGGSRRDDIAGMCLTADGDPVVVGTTSSTDFPTAAALRSRSTGGNEVFVSRLRADGYGFVFSTYFGGSDDRAGAVVRTPSGGILVAATTRNAGFIGEDDRVLGAPSDEWGFEGYLAEIEPKGQTLRRAARLGATNVGKIAAGPAGDLVLLASTFDDMPFPRAPRVPGDSEYSPDAMLLRLDATTWATLGGAFFGDRDQFYQSNGSLAVSPDGTVWVAGEAQSLVDAPALPGAARPLRAAGAEAYVAAFDPVDFTRKFATFLGGIENDEAGAVAVAADGSAWVAGQTQSPNFPTLLAVQRSLATTTKPFAQFVDCFVAQLLAGDPNGRPAPVVAPQAAPVDGHAVRVSWTPGDGAATAFGVDRSEMLLGAVLGYSRIGLVSADVSEFVDTSILPDRKYRYAVQALNTAGGSPASAQVVTTTPATLRVDVSAGALRLYRRRTPTFPAHGKVLRLRGTLTVTGNAPTVPDLRRDGLVLDAGLFRNYHFGHGADGNVIFSVPPGDSRWTVRRSGILRWRQGPSRIEIDPRTGAFDLVAVDQRGDGPVFSGAPAPIHFTTAVDAGSTNPDWRSDGGGFRTP